MNTAMLSEGMGRSGLKHQAGASKLGLLVTFLLLAMFLTFGLKVGPLYVNNNMVVSLVEDLVENGQAAEMTQSQLRERISNSLRINNISGLDLSSITMTRVDGSPVVTIVYESRVELISNLDVVAKFDTTVQ
ncbi:MAG: DUF4845 domain-containing protein [Pseudohongiellaceae bacterium]